MTEEEIHARKAASMAKRPAHEKIDNTKRLADSGLRVVHLPPRPGFDGIGFRNNNKGLTVAWRPNDNNGNRAHAVIEVATALCKRGDVFSRKLGTKQAIENYQAGKKCFVPLVDDDPVATIKSMFDYTPD